MEGNVKTEERPLGFPGSLVVKNPPANTGDTGLIPDPGRSPRPVRFSRQEYWSGLPFPPPGDLPDPEPEPWCPVSSSLAGSFFTTVSPGDPLFFAYRT